MKMSCTTLAVLATCLACGLVSAEAPVGEQEAAPYPASGWKPAGRLLLLPLRQQESAPSNEYGPPEQISATEYPPVTPQADKSDNASAFPASQQLQQQPEVNSGVYHVLLPDGRLQRVEFTTAPLKSEAAQSFTSPLQYQQQQAFNSDNSFSSQYQQQQPQEQLVSYEVQKSQNYELAPVQQFAFPGAFPGAFPQPSEGQNAKFTQGQAAGQAGFQKPIFQQNQFGLNTFEQSQTQQNQFGQNSFQQSPRGGKFSQAPTGFSQSSNAKLQQQRQYLSPRPNVESQSTFSQYKVSQSNAASGSNGKYTNGQQQQYQPQAQPQVFGYQQVYFTQSQQSEPSSAADAETVPTPPEGTAYVANVQYKDVEPIPGPIYSYNPAPLVRILRKTE